MATFSAGEQVVIRFGAQQGQQAEILECQPAGVYKVRAEDGSILFFGSLSLARQWPVVPKVPS
jgi:hypothetical protein